MTILRALLLELLVCFHVLGAAVLFRRLFPRESPWLGFFAPVLVVMLVLNFVEHFVALPKLGILLPVTAAGLFWGMARPGGAWTGLRSPAIFFVVLFTFCLVVRGMHPDIASWTEGVADLHRVVDFCLGDKVPPIDSWLPPFPHTGYYTFQHYGASLLTRLFTLDVGTGYNISFVLLDALICLVAGAVAWALTGRNWIAAAIMLTVVAAFTGSAIIMLLFNPGGVDLLLAYDLHHGWADAHHNPLWRLLDADPYQQRTRLFTPAYGIYLPEFHPNLGGQFLVLLTTWAAVTANRPERSNGPWIVLLVAPILCVLAATWFLPVVIVLAASGGALALARSFRPENSRAVLVIAGALIALAWPSLDDLVTSSVPQSVRLTTREEHTYAWLFVEQWWPVYIPWLALICVWQRLSPEARWLHACVPLLLILFELFTVGDREPTLEKIWSAMYGVGSVAFLSLVFAQKAWPFRIFTGFILVVSVWMLGSRWIESTKNRSAGENFFRLQGDVYFHANPPERRLVQVLQRLQGATVLTGKVTWGYAESPAMAAFSNNRAFVGWTFPEELVGHGEEAHARANSSNDFYSGAMDDPLPFLKGHDIAAVLVWPDDEIPDDLLTRWQQQLASDYLYIDCRQGTDRNTGVFLRIPPAP